MPRRKAVAHSDDRDFDLAPAVTSQQLTELSTLGYRGPTPSTQPQAAALIRRLREEQPRLGGRRKP